MKRARENQQRDELDEGGKPMKKVKNLDALKQRLAALAKKKMEEKLKSKQQLSNSVKKHTAGFQLRINKNKGIRKKSAMMFDEEDDESQKNNQQSKDEIPDNLKFLLEKPEQMDDDDDDDDEEEDIKKSALESIKQEGEDDEYTQFMNNLDKEAKDEDNRQNYKEESMDDDDDDGEENIMEEFLEMQQEQAEQLAKSADRFGEAAALAKLNKKVMQPVDHDKINYPPFRKNFYIPPKSLKNLTNDAMQTLRAKIGKISIHGRHAVAPINEFFQCGLSEQILQIMKASGYERPTPIQAQGIPIIMSGRDTIGIARTGSGKTLAFLLPLLRHILDQPPIRPGDGPIAIIMAPTRELATQIYLDLEKFTTPLGISALCAQGGTSLSAQIATLNRGVAVIVCTPGRMIDLLCANKGRATNLRRVTFVCLDEADRMFDMGFGPQILRIIQNIRPDKQIVMFSATFPRSLEALARKSLVKPLRVIVGGRSVASKTVKQHVEIFHEEKQKFLKLLELLGIWSQLGSILIFVDRQSDCGDLFLKLKKSGYDASTLHGGMDQIDRAYTLNRFKSGEDTILIATSIAARGIDVQKLELVINYSPPNHYEDYIHRIGRTGRAGRQGTAYTFILEDEEKYAPDLVKALRLSENEVPKPLDFMSESYLKKVKEGKEKRTWGFSGHGYQFDDQEAEKVKEDRIKEAKLLGFNEEGEIVDATNVSSSAKKTNPQKSTSSTKKSNKPPSSSSDNVPSRGKKSNAASLALAKAMSIANEINTKHDESQAFVEREMEINHFPEPVRRYLLDRVKSVSSRWSVGIQSKGIYVPRHRPPPPNERVLHLVLSGSKSSVDQAFNELQKQCVQIMEQLGYDPSQHEAPRVGRYKIDLV